MRGNPRSEIQTLASGLELYMELGELRSGKLADVLSHCLSKRRHNHHMARGEYYVSQDARRWKVQHAGTNISFETSKAALSAALGAAKTAGSRGFGGSVLIQKPDGQWKTEWACDADGGG